MPRRKQPLEGETPWVDGDPDKKICLNVPFPEPLMLQMDYLLQNKAIFSKSSFIRDAVAEATTRELQRLERVRQVIHEFEKKNRK